VQRRHAVDVVLADGGQVAMRTCLSPSSPIATSGGGDPCVVARELGANLVEEPPVDLVDVSRLSALA